ncbi:MAG: S41 family peptidase [Armatimonadota bacterium]
MIKTHPRLLIALGIIVAIMAFGAGTFTGMGIGRGAFFTTAARVAQITSGTFEHRKDINIPPITNLNALEVIWEVREKVKQQFVYPIKDDKKLTYGAVRGMLASLDDPYTRFLEPDEFKDFRTDNSGHFDGIGAVLEAKTDDKTGRDDIVISSVLPEGPASKTNLRSGDIVLKVDSTVVDGMTLTGVVKLIRGMRGTPVTLTVLRKGNDKPIEIKIVRANVEVKVVEYKMLDPEKKIGYIWLRQFNQNAVKEMRLAVDDLTKQGMKGLVLDLSMDPGGLLDVAVEVGSMFIDHGPIVWTKNRGEEARPLNAIPGKAISKNVKIVTLIDGGSASASEIVAGALQDTGRATLVGQRSFGKAKVQTICELQDDSALFLSTALYLTPKMRDISIKDDTGKRGLKPEVLLPEPDPNKTDLKYKDWHESQIDLAKAELLKLMK